MPTGSFLRRRQPHPSSRHSHPGFSLVEVLVSLTLVGLVVGLAVPRMMKMSTQGRVQRAAQTMQAEVQQAFAIAGRNRTPVKLAWNSGSMQLRITNLAGTTTFRRAAVGTGVFSLTSSDVTMTPATLTVFPNGMANDSLVITVQKSGFTRTVRIARSGMVRSR